LFSRREEEGKKDLERLAEVRRRREEAKREREAGVGK
jgi:hypothetical protein